MLTTRLLSREATCASTFFAEHEMGNVVVLGAWRLLWRGGSSSLGLPAFERQSVEHSTSLGVVAPRLR
jgi:hypothetical protein